MIGEIVMLFRRIPSRSEAAHAGRWDKSADRSFEVRGKTLGIVGYGNIGSQLSTMAEAMGMRVIYYDVSDKLRHGNTEPVATLHDLLGLSDVVSLHVPETPATAGMIGPAEIAAMRPGGYPDQQQPRHGGGYGRAGGRAAQRTPKRRGRGRVPGRARQRRGGVRLAAAGPCRT